MLNLVQEPRKSYVQCASPSGLHRMAYWTWGDDSPNLSNPDNKPTIICAHGLTRNGRDFDVLASQLSDRYRVIAVDFVGRGESDWLSNAMHYQVPQYVQDALTLLTQLALAKVIWIGTSMGGLVGMAIAAMPGNEIRGLLLNDIGPDLGAKGIARISSYVGETPTLFSYQQARDLVIANSAPFGKHSADQWDYFVRHYVRQKGDEWIFNYDPDISLPFKLTTGALAVQLWPIYDSISCPTHVIRGAESDLLERDTALAMTQRGPKATLDEVAEVGHAPTLMPENQIRLVEKFLAQL